ncbi:MAG: sugar ABC transporter ATP-binding protein [Chloroflexi bacterium]|nr:sugar ABC transporter ATP-binding protein [Chloroflexota bacterium]
MSEPKPYLLEMRDICKSFFGVQVLHNMHFDLRAGEVHVLVGENGAGKSTLMKILSAAYQADSGHIFIDGQAVQFHHPAQARAAGISTIYQHFSQATHLSIAENLFLGNLPRNPLGMIDYRRLYQLARAALEAVGATVDPRLPVRRLGIGDRQLVEIAAALTRNARIIIMDEPTAALTDREVDRLFALVHQLKAQGVGIIYISHRLEELHHIADRVTVLRDGRSIGTQTIAEVEIDNLVRMMIGRDLQAFDAGAPEPDAFEVLRIEGFTRAGKYEDINFTLRRGEIVALTGLMGAGRTEVAEGIFGVTPPDSGAIYVRGQRVQINQPGDALRHDIGFLTEDRAATGLGMALNIRENMTLPYWAQGRDYIYGLLLNHRRERQLTDDYARSLNVRARNLSTAVKYLSGGNQQKVVLAKWLLARSSILIADEPTLGIDIGAKEEVHRLLIDFARQQGGAVLLISSDLPEALKLSDRILVMAHGRLVGELSRAEATEKRIMAFAFQVE